MSYFELLPNVYYPDPLSSRPTDRSRIEIKNIFRRAKLRDDIQSNLTLFEKYEIRAGARPDTIAEEYYGDSGLDWLVLISNNITRITDQWPLDDAELYDYALEKYGNLLNTDAFYETTEVKDSQGRLIYPAGVVVDADFTIPHPDGTSTALNPVRGVTYFENEIRINNEKRSIFLLRPLYVKTAINDIREQLHYKKSSQFVNKQYINSDNVRLSNQG
jgi:hypothetical protein